MVYNGFLLLVLPTKVAYLAPLSRGVTALDVYPGTIYIMVY
jgi:hypothetical protein